MAGMRLPAVLVRLLLLIGLGAAFLLCSGCEEGRDQLNPFYGPDLGTQRGA